MLLPPKLSPPPCARNNIFNFNNTINNNNNSSSSSSSSASNKAALLASAQAELVILPLSPKSLSSRNCHIYRVNNYSSTFNSNCNIHSGSSNSSNSNSNNNWHNNTIPRIKGSAYPNHTHYLPDNISFNSPRTRAYLYHISLLQHMFICILPPSTT